MVRKSGKQHSPAFAIICMFITLFTTVKSSQMCACVAGNMTWESLQVGSNIKFVDWAPQNDVLAHPAVKLFVTQSGINSLYEAAYNAVPMVSVPIIGDQINNAAKVSITCDGKVWESAASAEMCFEQLRDLG